MGFESGMVIEHQGDVDGERSPKGVTRSPTALMDCVPFDEIFSQINGNDSGKEEK